MISKTTSNYSLFTEETTGAWSVVSSIFSILRDTTFGNTKHFIEKNKLT
ncbi:hypothetical protein [Priestia megaterium]|nr:hypothetical protein [Priestia megaterium]MBT2255960.1 hypothetical protein [Priestia megaterium]MBT2281245.1 hypothetical protein [Priestia megaterium]